MTEMIFATTASNLVISEMNVPIHLLKSIMMMIYGKEGIKEKKLKPLPLSQKRERRRLVLMELTIQKSAALTVIPQNPIMML